jgi:hypothetical protein
MTARAKRQADSAAVYIAETAVLKASSAGSNVTDLASQDDNQTSLNVTSPFLNNFYFYKVSYLRFSQST